MRLEATRNLAVFLTYDGVFPRSYLYSANVSNESKRTFKDTIAEKLFGYLQQMLDIPYEDYNLETHLCFIRDFADEVSREFSTLLSGGQLRIGTAQKFVNLFWKINWLLFENVREPIHCPFDSIIIAKLGTTVRHLRWTNFNTLHDYTLLVNAAQERAGDLSIAQWELAEYLRSSSLIRAYRLSEEA
jgi:hypothetical protein